MQPPLSLSSWSRDCSRDDSQLPHSGKLSRKKNFEGENFHEFQGFGSIRKSFLHKNRRPHTLIIGGAKQSTKVFSTNFLLSPIRQSFLPRKFPRYTVCTHNREDHHCARVIYNNPSSTTCNVCTLFDTKATQADILYTWYTSLSWGSLSRR